MSNAAVELVQMEHRERLLLKQRLQVEREERTPTSSTMQLVDEEESFPWDPTNPHQFFLAICLRTHARERIGSFWGVLPAGSGIARLYDFFMLHNERAAGYGMEALTALEHWLQACGARELRMNIMHHSPLTLTLLERVGYITRSIAVQKRFPLKLDPEEKSGVIRFGPD